LLLPSERSACDIAAFDSIQLHHASASLEKSVHDGLNATERDARIAPGSGA
jgi:hypothetical protein